MIETAGRRPTSGHDRLVEIVRATFVHPMRSDRAVTPANVRFLLAEVERRTAENVALKTENDELRRRLDVQLEHDRGLPR